MIEELRTTKSDGNPFIGRSVSEVAWMLLSEELQRQHKRYCDTKGG